MMLILPTFILPVAYFSIQIRIHLKPQQTMANLLVLPYFFLDKSEFAKVCSKFQQTMASGLLKSLGLYAIAGIHTGILAWGGGGGGGDLILTV